MLTATETIRRESRRRVDTFKTSKNALPDVPSRPRAPVGLWKANTDRNLTTTMQATQARFR